jgi:hypothetical protein
MNRKTYVYLSGAITRLTDGYENLYKVLGKMSSSTSQPKDIPVTDTNTTSSVLSTQENSEIGEGEKENSLEDLLNYISDLSTQIVPEEPKQS